MRYSIQGATVVQVKNAGGADIKELKRVGIIYATLDDKGVAALKSQGFSVVEVKDVKAADYIAPIAPPVPMPYETGFSPVELISIIGFDESWRSLTSPPLYGEGISVAVIDSGIRRTHEKIRGQVAYSENFTSEAHADDFNHATGVASIILAIAPKCKIVDLKVLDGKGMGTDEGVVVAIDKAIELNSTDLAPVVINLSIGEDDDGNPYDAVRSACRAAVASGMYVVAAAGNAGPTPGSIMSPACEQYVIAIGSLAYYPEDPRYPLLISSFSGRGPTKQGLVKPDAVLPGERIEMASSVSDTATAVKSGTSFATPMGSVMVVMYQEAIRKTLTYPGALPPGVQVEYKPYIPPSELIDHWLLGLCVKPDVAPRGKDNDYGCGIPFGGLVASALKTAAAAEVDIFTPMASIFAIGLMGAMISGMFKGDLSRV
jgi:serine protease AprX